MRGQIGRTLLTDHILEEKEGIVAVRIEMNRGVKSGEEEAKEEGRGTTAEEATEVDMEEDLCVVEDEDEEEAEGVGIALLIAIWGTVKAIKTIIGGGKGREVRPMRGVFIDLSD